MHFYLGHYVKVLQKEITLLLKKMDNNPAYWEKLKQKLVSLSDDNCLVIQSVFFKYQENTLQVMGNGMFETTSFCYEKVSKELCDLMEQLIK